VDGQYLVERILALIAEQPITPSLRQIYYLLVNEGTIPKGTYTVTGRGGTPVERDSYKELSQRATRMRKGGILAYDALIDGGRARRTGRYFTKPSEALAYAAAAYYLNRWHGQPVIPELWGEAGSIENILWQIAYQYDVDVMVAHGNSSLTFLYEAASMIAALVTRHEDAHSLLRRPGPQQLDDERDALGQALPDRSARRRLHGGAHSHHPGSGASVLPGGPQHQREGQECSPV
jgi:hypothetical protein